MLTKHLAAEVIHRHCDTLNMRWIEGRAETAPTLDSVESYIQSWVEDCEYMDERGREEYEGIDEIQEDRKGKGRRVHFSDLVTVRPIPSAGKDKPTLPRSKSAGIARWQPGEAATTDAIDRKIDSAGLACKCACGGPMIRGDGKHWAEAEDCAECFLCARQK